MLILIVGPSGAGKDTLLLAARARLTGDGRVRFARREVTRPETPGGEPHLPVDRATFAARREAGAYALWWEAHGLAYGIPADIAADLARGVTVVASVSRAVIAEAASRFAVRVVEITAPRDVLAARLAARGREGAEDIERRLQRSVDLPEGVELVTVMNDASVAEGCERLLAAMGVG
jgi:phosphonate metabolism protein PhnN/1,5-bisphosphokinase (PRPP-forming)